MRTSPTAAQTESRMAHMAYHDGLTDLPNRAAFLQALAQMIEGLRRPPAREFAVLSLDLDGAEGNQRTCSAMRPATRLLIEVARRLQAAAGGGIVARLSGDEFGLIIRRQATRDPARRWPSGSPRRSPTSSLIDGKSVRHRRDHRHLGISA